MALEVVDPALHVVAEQQSRPDQEPPEAGIDELGGDLGIGDRAGADRTRRPGLQRGLEQRAAEVDVALAALLFANVLVVDGDDAVLGVDDAVELVVIGDLDERRQPVAQGGLDQALERGFRQDPRGEQDGRGAHLLGALSI